MKLNPFVLVSSVLLIRRGLKIINRAQPPIRPLDQETDGLFSITECSTYCTGHSLILRRLRSLDQESAALCAERLLSVVPFLAGVCIHWAPVG